MKSIFGTGISPGTARGPLRFVQRIPLGENCRTVSDPEGQVLRFQAARGMATEQLEALRQSTQVRLGGDAAVLFEIHRVMLEDEEFGNAVENVIRTQALEAACAVHAAAQELMLTFSHMENEYMRARSADVLDISRRVAAILSGVATDLVLPAEPCILAADDLMPSEVAQLTPETALAFITSHGSALSHTALLARAMHLPAVAEIGRVLLTLAPGQILSVDGHSGQIDVDEG